MNTPRQKKRHKIEFKPPLIPKGKFVSGLANEEYAKRFAAIITLFEHVESYMPRVLARLIGIDNISPMSPAGYIYRVLRNPSIRSDVLRTLLEAAPNNVNADEKFDEILSAYESIRSKRNNYAHGIWWTSLDDNSVYLSISDPHGLGFLQSAPIELDELDKVLDSIHKLTKRLWVEI